MRSRSDEDADAQLAVALSFLRDQCIDEVTHSQGDLMAHLVGTRALLIAWGSRPVVCWAGLFHSVFGTDRFGGRPCPEHLRVDVRRMIGDEAERLVWLFGTSRRTSYLQVVAGASAVLMARDGRELEASSAELVDLAELHVANAVEQLPRLPSIYTVIEKQRLAPCLPLVTVAARRALDRVEGEDVLVDREHVRARRPAHQ